MGKSDQRASRHGQDANAGLRSLRLEQLFLEEVNSILGGEVSDRRFDAVRATRVELARDGSRARIWIAFTAAGQSAQAAQIMAAFERASRFFRSRLCEALNLKRMPELTFRYDPAHVAPESQPLLSRDPEPNPDIE